MTLVESIERGLAGAEEARLVSRLLEAVSAMMAAWPSGAREMTAYRLAEQALADALAVRPFGEAQSYGGTE